ncbi:hypothetical protein C0J52_26249 [Blattella germanica]|nr:hypothetical protein C0J52_26249 [Blattella germanica]
MYTVCRNHIKKEISSANFVSVIVDEIVIGSERTGIEAVSNALDIAEASARRRNVHLSRTDAAREVFDIVVNQVKIRFSFTAHVSAISFFNGELFCKYHEIFPEQVFEETIKVFTMLEKNRLRTELQLIYKRWEFRKLRNASSLLQFLVENKLQSNFSETYKLLLLVNTIPIVAVDTPKSSSSLKRIETFLRSSTRNSSLNNLGMVSIEQNLIADITNFNERVIDLFISEKVRRLDFVRYLSKAI